MTTAILYVLSIVVILSILGLQRRRKSDRWVRVVPQQMAERTQEARPRERKQEERPSPMPTANAGDAIPNTAHR